MVAEVRRCAKCGQPAVVLVDSDIRRFVRRLLEYSFPDVTALSYEELTPDINVQPLGVIALIKDPQKLASVATEIEAKK